MRSQDKFRVMSIAYNVAQNRTAESWTDEDLQEEATTDEVVIEAVAYLRWLDESRRNSTVLTDNMPVEQQVMVLQTVGDILSPLPATHVDFVRVADQLAQWLVSRKIKNPGVDYDELFQIVWMSQERNPDEKSDRIDNILKRAQKYVDLFQVGPRLKEGV